MNEEERLLAAVIAAPDDDAPRLAYAELLTARGDPRGELIAVQVALDRLSPAERPWALLQRSQELAKALGPEAWLPAIKGMSVFCRRGLPEALSVGGADFVERAAEVFATAPVRELALDLPASALARLLAMPELSRLSALSMKGIGDEGLTALFSSPYLGGLQRLELYDNALGDEGAAVLAASPHLRGVQDLNLARCGIGVPGARALAVSPVLASVTRLVLAGNDLREGVEALGGSPYVGELRSLELSDTGTIDAGAAALAASDHLGELRRLDLRKNAVGDAGAIALARSTKLPRLSSLDLAENGVGEAGAEALASAAGLPNLRVLGLSYNPLYVPGKVEEWTDWDGSPTGSGPVIMDAAELQARYGRRFKVE